MSELSDLPPIRPSEAVPPEIHKAYVNSLMAYKIASEKYYSNLSSKEEREKEAEIVRKSLNKIRQGILTIYGEKSLDYVDWMNVGSAATSDEETGFIWYLPKSHRLIQAPEKREKRDGVPFKIGVPDVQGEPIEANKLEWILKAVKIAGQLQEMSRTKPPQPKQTSFNI